MKQLKNFRALLPLFFFLFFVPSCQESLTPSKGLSTPILGPRPWEQLPYIDLKWVHPSFSATIGDSASTIDLIEFPFDTVKHGDPLVFRPKSGNYASISSGSDKNINTIEASFLFSPEIDQSMKSFKSYAYFNGQYEGLDNHLYHSKGHYSAPIRGANTHDRLRLTDTWYFIFVFRGTDKKDYQYRTPEMSIANAY